MKRRAIPLDDLRLKPIHLWDIQHLVLTAGDFARGDFNAMTIGWGSLGVMWSRPFVQVVVRPVRYTYEFLERHESFTVCAFPARWANALDLLGTKSGRAGDKIAEAGLHPIASAKVAAPGYAEAELILECRKIYSDDLDPRRFLDTAIEAKYLHRDYHRIYFGEIVAAVGTPRYGARAASR